MDAKKAEGRSFDILNYPEKDLTEKIIGAAIEVHKQIGPGFTGISISGLSGERIFFGRFKI